MKQLDALRNRSQSVLPPINSQQSKGTFDRERGSFNSGRRTPGRLVKLTRDDLNSDTRSIYKLDPSVPVDNRGNPYLSPRSNGMSSNLERVYAKLDIQDRAQILDKLHKMRIKAADKWGNTETVKPHVASVVANDKDKIVEQYYAAKRQLNPDNEIR